MSTHGPDAAAHGSDVAHGRARCSPMGPALPTRVPNAAHRRTRRHPPAGPVLPTRVPSAALSRACQGPVGCPGSFVAAVFNCRNKNLGVFATFLRLGAPFRLCKAKTGCREAAHLRFYAADPHLGALRQSLIAKKLQSRVIFCFWILVRVQSGMGPLVGLPLSPPFAPKASEWDRFALKPMVQWCDLWRRCRRTRGGWKKSPTFSHRPQNRYLGVLFGL